jgi:hypothetical protein
MLVLGHALVQVVECTVWHTCAKLLPHELTAGYRRYVAEEGYRLRGDFSSLKTDLVVLGVVARVQRMIRPIHLVSAQCWYISVQIRLTVTVSPSSSSRYAKTASGVDCIS